VVHNWVEKYSQGRSKVTDEIVTEATVQQVEELIRDDRRITINSVATALGCSNGLAYSIMHDLLKFQKLCASWIPRELKDREKMK
jgi:ribosomal protein S25